MSPLPAGQSELFHVLRVEAGGGSGCQGPGDPAAPEGRPAPPKLAAGAGGVLCQPDRRAGGAAGRQERSHRGAPTGAGGLPGRGSGSGCAGCAPGAGCEDSPPPISALQKLEEKLQAQADYEEIKTELRYGSAGVRACRLPVPWPAGCRRHPRHTSAAVTLGGLTAAKSRARRVTPALSPSQHPEGDEGGLRQLQPSPGKCRRAHRRAGRAGECVPALPPLAPPPFPISAWLFAEHIEGGGGPAAGEGGFLPLAEVPAREAQPAGQHW